MFYLTRYMRISSSSGAGKCNRRRIDGGSRPSLRSAALLGDRKGLGWRSPKDGVKEKLVQSRIARYFSEEGPTLGDCWSDARVSPIPVRGCPRDIRIYFRFTGSANWLKILIVFKTARVTFV